MVRRSVIKQTHCGLVVMSAVIFTTYVITSVMITSIDEWGIPVIISDNSDDMSGVLERDKRATTLTDFNSVDISPSDPRLLKIIRKRFLFPPATLPYHIPIIGIVPDGQHDVVDAMFNSKSAGTFVEAGAYTGYSLSNTIFFEMYRGWSGLLVEAMPDNFETLLSINRKSFKVNTCLSSHNYPEQALFENTKESYLSKMVRGDNDNANTTKIQCFPLLSLLLAANITQVDYFSLDVEGFELDVLKGIPWADVDIKVLSIEHKNLPEGKDALMSFMQSKGYSLVTEMSDRQGTPTDIIVARSDILHELNLTSLPLQSSIKLFPNTKVVDLENSI